MTALILITHVNDLVVIKVLSTYVLVRLIVHLDMANQASERSSEFQSALGMYHSPTGCYSKDLNS